MDSFARFQKKEGGINMKDLSDNMEPTGSEKVKNVVCQINKWQVHLVKNNSDLSYNGFEMRLVIHQIELLKFERMELP